MKRGADPDPVLSEVIANLLMSVADEIGLSLIRTAHSPNIRERRDCSTAVLDARGQIVAQPVPSVIAGPELTRVRVEGKANAVSKTLCQYLRLAAFKGKA